MKFTITIIRIVLALVLLYLGFSDFLNGMFSDGLAAYSIYWDIMVNDLILQGLGYMALGVCFLLNVKWLLKKWIAIIIIVIFVGNTILLGITFKAYLEMIAEIILLLLLYMLIFLGEKKKISQN